MKKSDIVIGEEYAVGSMAWSKRRARVVGAAEVRRGYTLSPGWEVVGLDHETGEPTGYVGLVPSREISRPWADHVAEAKRQEAEEAAAAEAHDRYLSEQAARNRPVVEALLDRLGLTYLDRTEMGNYPALGGDPGYQTGLTAYRVEVLLAGEETHVSLSVEALAKILGTRT